MMNFEASGYRISTDPAELDVEVIHDVLRESYSARGIPRDTLERAIEGLLCFGLFHHGTQVGFARMITDAATFAYLADVFVVEGHRGKGLSTWLMEFILAHPSLQGLRRIALATADAHGLYERFGFTPLADPDRFMELWVPDPYDA